MLDASGVRVSVHDFLRLKRRPSRSRCLLWVLGRAPIDRVEGAVEVMWPHGEAWRSFPISARGSRPRRELRATGVDRDLNRPQDDEGGAPSVMG
jgi:hypothetical protein